jgi:hypothetical protein
MVSPDRRYHLSREGVPDIALDGAWLNRMGFTVPPMKGEEVLMIEVTAL